MDAAIAIYASAAVLLVIAGAVKLARPATTAALLDELGAPAVGPIDGVRLTVLLGVAEIGLGVAALVAELAAIALLVGLLYVGFALTVLRAMRLGAGSCGCFGRVDAPPSWWHVVGNVALAACAFIAATGRSPLEVMDGQPAGGVGFVAIVGVLAGLELVVFTSLPAAMEARRPAGATRS